MNAMSCPIIEVVPFNGWYMVKLGEHVSGVLPAAKAPGMAPYSAAEIRAMAVELVIAEARPALNAIFKEFAENDARENAIYLAARREVLGMEMKEAA